MSSSPARLYERDFRSLGRDPGGRAAPCGTGPVTLCCRTDRGRPGGARPRLRALFRLRRRCGDPRARRAGSSPAATSRTPPTRRASAPRPPPIGVMVAGGRAGDRRAGADRQRRVCSARPAAAAASAWPSSGGPRRRSIWPVPRACARPRRWERCCRWRSARSTWAVRRTRASRRRRRDPRRAGGRAAARRARPGLGARRHRRADRGRRSSSTIATCRAFRGPSVQGHAGRLRARPARRRAGGLPAGPRPSLRGQRYRGRSTASSARSRPSAAGRCILTNASGSLRPSLGPGSLVLVEDHINLQGTNPLVGANDEAVGPRFVDLSEVYAPAPARGAWPPPPTNGDRTGPRRLSRRPRAGLRDAGRDPRLPHPGCRSGRHVDRARGDQRPARRARGRGPLGRHQPRRRHGGGTAHPCRDVERSRRPRWAASAT